MKAPTILRLEFSKVSKHVMLVLIFVRVQQMVYLTLCENLSFSVPSFLHLLNGESNSKEPYEVIEE